MVHSISYSEGTMCEQPVLVLFRVQMDAIQTGQASSTAPPRERSVCLSVFGFASGLNFWFLEFMHAHLYL